MSGQAAGNSGRRLADLAVLVVLAALVALYLFDAVRASRDILNLILVLPLSVLVLGLCAVQFVVSMRQPDGPDGDSERVLDVLPVMGLFAAYVLLLPWLGFDVGTAIFVGAFLWMQGERRLPWLLAYSIVFAAVLALFFARMLPYPMPMLIAPG